MSLRCFRTVVLLLALSVGVDYLAAAEPSIRTLNQRGLQVGNATTLTIDGDDLGKSPSLLLPFPATVQLKSGNTDRQAIFEVTPTDKAVTGYYHLRLVSEGGVSLPTLVSVDRLAQKAFGPTIDTLPAALHGTASGNVPVETKFTGKKGTPFRIEVEAQRIGSKLRPVVHLIGPKKTEVAWSWPTPLLGGDTRLETTLPDDGEYTITLHDSEYAGANPGFFRLRVGPWASVEQVFPPLIGKGGQAVEMLTSRGVEKVQASPLPGSAVVALPWPDGATWSGPRPFVRVSDRPELLEQPSAAKGQDLPEGPVAVSGRLSAPLEEDRYNVPVKAGQKLRLEVQAEQIGSPIDVAVVVRNPMGTEVARGEDSPKSLDPVLDYTVPAGITTLTVGVLDAQARGGPRGIYRLSITPLPAKKSDLALLTATQRLSLPAKGPLVYPIGVERNGYTGSIELAADALPSGITLGNTTIPAGADGALVTLRRAAGAVPPAITTWRGKLEDGEVRTLVVKGHPLERLQPWLANEIALAGMEEPAEVSIDYRTLPPDVGLVPAGKLALPFKVTRSLEKNPIRVTLMTSQLGALATPPVDPNTQLRLEKALEIPATTAEGDAGVIVPATLAGPVYDVTLKAELLSPDKAKVLATAFAPVQRLPVKLPLVLQMAGPRFEVKRDPKATVTLDLVGKLERREGATGDVQLTLTGLPAGIPAVPVTTVKADASTFALKLTVPPNQPVGETPLKLSGTIVADPKQPNVRVRSRDVDFTLVVQ